jgi:hypothetical protein
LPLIKVQQQRRQAGSIIFNIYGFSFLLSSIYPPAVHPIDILATCQSSPCYLPVVLLVSYTNLSALFSHPSCCPCPLIMSYLSFNATCHLILPFLIVFSFDDWFHPIILPIILILVDAFLGYVNSALFADQIFRFLILSDLSSLSFGPTKLSLSFGPTCRPCPLVLPSFPCPLVLPVVLVLWP